MISSERIQEMGQGNKTRVLAVAAALAFAVSPVAAQTPTQRPSKGKGSTSHHSVSAKGKARKTSGKHVAKGRKSRKASWKTRGQQKIDPQRAQDIQTALIREHYLSGKPTGQWDADSQKAMETFQADQGWQSKVVPDSRALIKLGLGPDQHPLLNPSTAMVAPAPPQASSLPPSASAQSANKNTSNSSQN